MSKVGLSNNPSLNLFKASAGSGKTHRLTGEYLTLLFDALPNANYRHILAVTFTNKATDEMKSRIVQELHRLANGDKSDYLKILTTQSGKNEKTIRQEAGNILRSLLHDYSAFSVSTIDRFFQQTMRAFARELGLSGSYNVEVDEQSMLPKVVDLMLFELDKSDNEVLKEWIASFMKERIQEGKSWRIHTEIETLGKEIFKEKYKKLTAEQRAHIKDKSFLEDYKKKLHATQNQFISTLKDIGKKALGIMQQQRLAPSDFNGKSSSQFYKFVDFANGDVPNLTRTFLNFEDNLEAWTTKTTPNETKIAVETAYHAGLKECVKAAIAHYEHNGIDYFSAKVILQNFNVLAILNDVRNRMLTLQKEENTLFISDTTELLNKIVSESEAPFIYEKIGTRVKHYMIDEFQDTSGMQWENFRPLIEESLSTNNFNLIVGDVKQSIYRFRNSDWKLFEEQIDKDFQNRIQHHTLDTNWRSDAQVIRFNNSFFHHAPTILQRTFNDSLELSDDDPKASYLQNKITNVYADSTQHIPDKKPKDDGYVEINFMPDTSENDWCADVLQQLPHTLETLQDNGFALKDIAIVVRKKKEAELVAQTLLQYKESHPESIYRYDIISDEALKISNAASVKAAVALFRHFQQRDNETRKALAVYAYYQFVEALPPAEALEKIFSQSEIDFPETVRTHIESLAFLPIYEIAESFFALAKNTIGDKENAYIQAFLDAILSFTQRESSNINDFLLWWDEKGADQTLYLPEGQDAVRLITIHKSKGLGFGVVVMPFVDWTFDNTSNGYITNYIWCEPNKPPFDAMKIVPLRYTSSLANTIFKDDYYDEKMHCFIDNLNLLYVAFTRAKHQLIVFAPRKPDKKKKKGENITIKNTAELLWQTLSSSVSDDNNNVEIVNLSDYMEDVGADIVRFSMGMMQRSTEAAASDKVDMWKIQSHSATPFTDRLKMRLSSIGYFSDDGSRDYGTAMHQIISRIRTTDDIENAVEQSVFDGIVDNDEKQTIIDALHTYTTLPETAAWFSGEYHVLNEIQTLHPRLGFTRPDRVMLDENNEAIVVDYKFGETEKSSYIRQVQRYKQELKEMGYAPVKGYLFYVTRKKVIEV